MVDTLDFIKSQMGDLEKPNIAYSMGEAAVETSGQKGLDYSEYEGDAVLWVPAEDRQENIVDIIPFIFTQEWYERLLSYPPTQEQRAAGQKYAAPRGKKRSPDGRGLDGYLEMPFHRFADGYSGDIVCIREAFGDKCPHCEEKFERYKMRKAGDPTAEEIAKSLSPQWRTFFNIYNYNYQYTPNAPEDHHGFEIIDDFGRGVFLKNILAAARNTRVGEGFVYPWTHPTEGYSLKFQSVWKPPTSAKFKKGHYDFPVINFEKRPEGTDYTEDIEYSIQFDKLVTPLIFTYDEMADKLKSKLSKAGIAGPAIFSTGMMEGGGNFNGAAEHNTTNINNINEDIKKSEDENKSEQRDGLAAKTERPNTTRSSRRRSPAATEQTSENATPDEGNGESQRTSPARRSRRR